MDEDDNTLKDAFSAIEHSNKVNCFGCGKELDPKNTIYRDIPGTTGSNPFCNNKSCVNRFIDNQIEFYKRILRGLHDLRPEVLKCPNCGEKVIEFTRRETPFTTVDGQVYVAMAIHKEVVGKDGERVPERFCHLDEVDWNGLFGIGESNQEHENEYINPWGKEIFCLGCGKIHRNTPCNHYDVHTREQVISDLKDLDLADLNSVLVYYDFLRTEPDEIHRICQGEN